MKHHEIGSKFLINSVWWELLTSDGEVYELSDGSNKIEVRAKDISQIIQDVKLPETPSYEWVKPMLVSELRLDDWQVTKLNERLSALYGWPLKPEVFTQTTKAEDFGLTEESIVFVWICEDVEVPFWGSIEFSILDIGDIWALQLREPDVDKFVDAVDAQS